MNANKCKFFQNKVEFLGHIIDNNGIHPTEEKVIAIKAAPVPKTITELKSYLGLLNYYGKCIPMLSTKLKPFMFCVKIMSISLKVGLRNVTISFKRVRNGLLQKVY